MTEAEARQEIIEIERLTNELLKRVAVFMNHGLDDSAGKVVLIELDDRNVVFGMEDGGELEVDLTE
jgi:hypothetical protein